MVSTWKSLFLVISLYAFGLAYSSDTNTTDTPKDDDDNEGRIINGERAGYGQFPWQAFLKFDDGVLCGGSIVGKQYILTAAHCIYGRAAGTVLLGGLNRDDPNARKVRVKYTVSHPNYKPPSLANDIGIVRTASDIPEAANIKIIPVASGTSYVNGGDYLFVSGFGADKDQGSTNSDLKYAGVRAITNTECVKRNGGQDAPGMLCCVGDNGQGICSGDSGGPLIQNMNGVWTVVGVVSYTVGGCESGRPNGYARVSNYNSFITSEITKN